MVMGKEEVEKKEVEKVEKEEELMVMEKEEVEKREVTFVSLVDSMPPAPDTAPTASTVQQGRSAGLPAGKEAFNGEDGHHGGSLFPGGRSLETCRRLKSLSSGLVAGERRPALFYEPYSFPSRMRISVKVNFQ